MMSFVHHRRSAGGAIPPRWFSMIPLFVCEYGGMSLLRTLGDARDPASGLLDAAPWRAGVGLLSALLVGAVSVTLIALLY